MGFSQGDFVVVSAENKTLIALTQGTVVKQTHNEIQLALDRSVNVFTFQVGSVSVQCTNQ